MQILDIGRLRIFVGVIERGNNGVNPPWMGFCWGSWLPRAKIDRQGPSWCLDSSWLCFHSSAYWNDKR